MAKQKVTRSRRWLNPDGRAYIMWEVARWGGSVSIGDCNRTVALEFNSEDPKRSLRKLDILQNELVAFRHALEAHYNKEKTSD